MSCRNQAEAVKPAAIANCKVMPAKAACKFLPMLRSSTCRAASRAPRAVSSSHPRRLPSATCCSAAQMTRVSSTVEATPEDATAPAAIPRAPLAPAAVGADALDKLRCACAGALPPLLSALISCSSVLMRDAASAGGSATSSEHSSRISPEDGRGDSRPKPLPRALPSPAPPPAACARAAAELRDRVRCLPSAAASPLPLPPPS